MDAWPKTIELPFEFMRDWIHDMRNSFYAIRVGLDVLAQAGGDAERTGQILAMLTREIVEATGRLDDFSQVTKGKEIE